MSKTKTLLSIVAASLLVVANASADSGTKIEPKSSVATENTPPPGPLRMLNRSRPVEQGPTVAAGNRSQSGMQIGPTPTGTLGTPPAPGQPPIGSAHEGKGPLGAPGK